VAPPKHKAKAGPGVPAASDAAQATGAKDPAEAARHYTEGVKAYQAGKFDAAVQSMSAAMQGGLTNNLVPKALYYRGAAYNRLHQSALAISDLSSALYFKSGLEETERVEALKQRSAAYAEAGLPDQPDPGSSGTATAAQASVQSEVPKASGLGLGNIFGDLFGPSTEAKSEAKPQAAGKPNVVIEAPAAAPVPAPATAPAIAAQESTGEVLPWARERTTGATSEPVTPAAGPQAAPVTTVAKPHGPKGHFRIQVASVASRDEASLVISSLQGKGEPLASAPVSVDEQKFGPKTFYRVRLGPYATAAETKAPCDALKASGLDCLVTAK